ncbi:MAG: hypothetical protein HOY69_15700 [Streptomyces sp.]|nr:hypothetical protein [Streptomyces sp.]
MSGGPVPDHVRRELGGSASEAWLRCADVIYGRGGPLRAAAVLRRYPGCLLVSLRDGGGRCVTLVRAGRGRVAVHVHTGINERHDHAELVARLYARLVGGVC